jgi:hypothetical protein
VSQNPARHLDAAAEGVRAFNHTSRSAAKDWQFPSDSYSALGNLSYLVQMLGQTVEQSTVPVMNMYEQGRIRVDGNGNADTKFGEMLDALQDARDAAAALTDAVQRMHNATSPMGADTTGMPGFEDDEDDE